MSRTRISPRRGRFIVLEGIDGAGTTTQARELTRALRQAGLSVHATREPSRGYVGKLLRRMLSGVISADARELALLFAADRRDHIEREILPALRRGDWVVCDRYLLSSLAYQSQNCPIDWVVNINVGAIPPDITILLDVPARQALQRVARRRGGTREIFETLPQQIRIRTTYRQLVRSGRKSLLGPIELVDGRTTPDVVFENVWRIVGQRCPELLR